MCNKQKAPAPTEAQNNQHIQITNSCSLLQDLYTSSESQDYREPDEYDVESGLRILDDFEVSDLLLLDECYAENGGYYGGY